MIYDKDANTILEGFGLTEIDQKVLVQEYFIGNRGKILARICKEAEDGILNLNEAASLLVEFGSRLVLDEAGEIAKEYEEFLRSNSGPHK